MYIRGGGKCLLKQGVRIEGVETPVSTIETNCHSVSSLPILLFLKITALCDLKYLANNEAESLLALNNYVL